MIVDGMTLTIPNWLTISFALCFLIPALGLPIAPIIIMQNIGVAVTVLLIGFLLFSLGFLGGGDAKFLAALALWTGWPDILTCLAWIALTGGALAIIILLSGSNMVPPAVQNSWPIWKLQKFRKKVPYGIAIGAGGIASFAKLTIF